MTLRQLLLSGLLFFLGVNSHMYFQTCHTVCEPTPVLPGVYYKLNDCTYCEDGSFECKSNIIPATPSPTPKPATSVIGTVQSYISHNETHNVENLHFALNVKQTNETITVPMTFTNASLANGLVSGDNVKITIKPQASRRRMLSDGLTPIFDVVDIISAGTPTITKDFVVDNKPVNITSITMVVSTMCNTNTSLTTARVRQRYFNKYSLPGQATIQSIHSTCSYNKLLFLPENNIIVDNITLPCIGTWTGLTYDSRYGCNTAEIYGWMESAITQVKNRGIDLRDYKRRILLMPYRSQCPWSGLASVGCQDSCSTWINLGNKATDISASILFHELLHNVGLQHSNRFAQGVSQEYGDCSDPMGCGGSQPTTMICPSAPQQWKAGWASPVETLDIMTNFTDGKPVLFHVPVLALTDRNMLRLKISSLGSYAPSPSWTTPREHVLYISYRSKQRSPTFDSALSLDASSRVYIHSYNATIRNPPRPDPSISDFKPTLQGVLNINNGSIRSMRFPVRKFAKYWFNTINKGINITMISKTNTSATLSICRFSSMSENTTYLCTDGIDNDCNGLADFEDPKCQGL